MSCRSLPTQPCRSIRGPLAALLCCPLAAFGQPSQSDTALPSTRLAGQIELARLVDLASERLHLNVEYDESALKGTVTLRIGKGLSDEELWALLNQLLASRGLTTIRSSGSTISVVKAPDAANLARIDRLEGVADGSPAAGFATIAVRIEHRPVKEIADALATVLSKGTGRAVPIADTGIVLISDLQSRLGDSLAFIAMLDTPGAAVRITEVPLRGMVPTQMAALAAQIAAKKDLVAGKKTLGEVLPSPSGRAVLVVAPEDQIESWRELIASLDQGDAVESRTYTPRTFAPADVARLIDESIKPGPPGSPADERWRTVIDELTGSLIITTTQEQHQRIAALLARLDSVSAGARRPVRSFVVRNRPVAEVLAVLQGLIGAGVLDSLPPDASEPGLALTPNSQVSTRQVLPPGNPAAVPPATPLLPNTPAAVPPPSPIPLAADPPPITLTADEATGTILAVAEPPLLDRIESLILQLDVRQTQVMLEVLLVSLTDGQTLDLGVELEKFEFGTDAQMRLASLFGLSSSQGGIRTVGDPAGFSAVVLDPGDFSVVVRALKTVNQGRSLSMPRLLVNNNQQAVFNSVREEPFISTNASETVATTSFGGSVNAGTTVTLRPQIAEADHLVLDYSISLSSFVGESSDPALPPPRQQNQVQSVATIPDGYTVVVGGLEATTEGEAISQVPLLGDIPGLGELFKNRSRSKSRTRFFVFLRADVMRRFDLADLKYLSDRAAKEAAIDTGWPEMEPRVIR